MYSLFQLNVLVSQKITRVLIDEIDDNSLNNLKSQMILTKGFELERGAIIEDLKNFKHFAI